MSMNTVRKMRPRVRRGDADMGLTMD